MKCPNCEFLHTKVIDSRCVADNVVRKRRCDECGFVFHTEELEILDDAIRDKYWNEYYKMLYKDRSNKKKPKTKGGKKK